MGDFNNDTHVDILWRNASSGINIVWFMNGTDWAGSTEIMPVGDLSWKIVGTGDFNNDTHVDILWRNTSSGENVVWYMNGTNWAGSAVLLGVSDQNWQIVGTGDFNGDGNVDLLWRYNGAGGLQRRLVPGKHDLDGQRRADPGRGYDLADRRDGRL